MRQKVEWDDLCIVLGIISISTYKEGLFGLCFALCFIIFGFGIQFLFEGRYRDGIHRKRN